MQNTNWDSTILTNNVLEPSAPPLCANIPIAIARVIEPSELIK